MEAMPIYFILLQSLPETVILISLGLILIGVRPRLKETMLIAFIISLAAYLIRTLSLPPGVNVLIQLPILILLGSIFYHLRIIHAFLASCLGLVCIGLTETVCNILIAKISGISIEQALANPLVHLLFPLPEFFILTCVIIILLRYDLALFDIRELNDSKAGENYEE